MSGLLDLPWDICLKILLRLPVESLFRFRSVCKRWLTAIDDPSFSRAHTNRQISSHTTLVIRNTPCSPSDHDHHLYTFDLDAPNLFTHGDQEIISGSSLDLETDESSLLRRLPVSVCNGLILVRTNPTSCNPKIPLEIWNFSTHERLQLPPIDFSRSGPVYTGLGYDQAAQDFKAVAMDRQETHVYSLRSDRWTPIGVCLGYDDDEELLGPAYQGVFVCGAVHWLLDNSKIIALDLGKEKRRNIQLNASQKRVHWKSLDVLGGCLAVSGFLATYFDVWVMNDYDDDESWTKLFSMRWMNLTGIFRPFAYGKDKNQVFLNYSGLRSGFFLFDVESDSMKRVNMHDHLTGYLHTQIIPQTMFRLRDHCGGASGTSRIKPLGRSKKMIKVSCTTEEKH